MATDMQAIIDRFKTGRANMMDYGYGTPGSMTTAAPGFSPMNLPNARPVTPFPATSSNTPPRYGRPPSAYDVPASLAPMPPVTGTTQLPTGGNAFTYGQIPYAAGDPSRLPPQPGTALPFINRPPIDITVPTGGLPQTAGLNIQPWPPENMAEIGPAGAMPPPMASAYGPGPATNPAATAAATAGQGQPPQTSWMQDMMTGINGLLAGNAPKPLSPSQSYDAANASAAERARTQDRSGPGTDGYIRDAAGNVIGRDPRYANLTPSQMYDQISGRPTDDSYKTIGDSGNRSSAGWEQRPMYTAGAGGETQTTPGAIGPGFMSFGGAPRAAAGGNGGRAGVPVTDLPRTGGPMQPPRYNLAQAMTRGRGR